MSQTSSPQIGPFIQQLRKRKNLTLDGLAKLSGVSRSMLSQIERGQANPTLATVWSLADSLNIDISELIGARKSSADEVRIDVSSESFTPAIRTEDGLCILRILSPADRADTVEWYELTFAPGGTLQSSPHARGTREHLTILEGELVVTAGSQTTVISKGETARYPSDVNHVIANESSNPARALLVMTD